MKVYADLVQHVLDHGTYRSDRTGVGTYSVFGYQYRLDLQAGFPLLTTKRVNFDSVVAELLWFLRGETNTRTLNSGIWDAWADETGDLGPIYGKQWRQWSTHEPTPACDQLQWVIQEIKTNPQSRRLILNAWNVGVLHKMALPPCHVLCQFYVRDRYLDCQLYQRSADIALGVPFNIASYALLTHIIAQTCALKPGVFVHSFGDAHIYSTHRDGLIHQLQRSPRPLPTVSLTHTHWEALTPDDIHLQNYNPHPAIAFEIAV